MGVAHLRVAAYAAVLGAVLGTLSTPAAGQEVCDTCNLPWGSDCSMEPKQCTTHFKQLYAPYTDFGRFYVETQYMPLRRDTGGSVVYAMRRVDTFGDSRIAINEGLDGVFRTPDDLAGAGADGIFGTGDDIFTVLQAPVVQRGFSAGTAVLSTSDLPSNWESGLRFAAGYRLTESLRVEGSYFGLQEWDGTASVQDQNFNNFDDGSTDSIVDSSGNVLNDYTFDDGFFGPGTGSLFSPYTNFGNPLDPTYAFDLNNLVSIGFVSNLHSADVNFYYQLPVFMPRTKVTVLGGARYINVTERFRYFSRSDSFDAAADGTFDGGTTINLVGTNTDNQVFGPQAGALIQYQFADRGWLDFESKVAVMNNSSSQRTAFVTTVPGLISRAFSAGDDGVAFAGDLSLVAKIQPFDALMFDIGYHATFIDGLALAQENAVATPQVLQNGPASVNNNGDVIYHGPRIGARLTF